MKYAELFVHLTSQSIRLQLHVQYSRMYVQSTCIMDTQEGNKIIYSNYMCIVQYDL